MGINSGVCSGGVVSKLKHSFLPCPWPLPCSWVLWRVSGGRKVTCLGAAGNYVLSSELSCGSISHLVRPVAFWTGFRAPGSILAVLESFGFGQTRIVTKGALTSRNFDVHSSCPTLVL